MEFSIEGETASALSGTDSSRHRIPRMAMMCVCVPLIPNRTAVGLDPVPSLMANLGHQSLVGVNKLSFCVINFSLCVKLCSEY